MVAHRNINSNELLQWMNSIEPNPSFFTLFKHYVDLKSVALMSLVIKLN